MRFALMAALVMCVSCKSSSGEGAGVTPAPSTSSTGGATPPAAPSGGASPDPVDGGAGSATAPSGTPRIYVGSGDGKIRLFAFDADAGAPALTLVDTFAAGQNPSFLAIAPTGRFLYAVDENASKVQAFAVERPSGKLTPLGAVASGGAGPAYVGLDGSGKFVLVANYGGGTIAVFARNDDGKLGAPVATRAFGTDAQTHQIVADPTNAVVLVANKGLDAVSVLRLGPGGTLGDVPGGPFSAGDGARHLAIDTSGRRVYVVDELGSTVTFMIFDASSGTLTKQQTISTLPPGYAGTNTGAEIQLTSDGKHVLASNRGDDSLVVFDVNAADGKLTRTARVPTNGATPRHFSIEPSGRFLFVANQGSQGAGSVVVMRVDPTTGIPTAAGAPVDVPSPAWIGLVYL